VKNAKLKLIVMYFLKFHCCSPSLRGPAPCPISTRGFFPGVKAAGSWSWRIISS